MKSSLPEAGKQGFHSLPRLIGVTTEKYKHMKSSMWARTYGITQRNDYQLCDLPAAGIPCPTTGRHVAFEKQIIKT
ncbi:hypothetical protein J2X69_002132 [Algoriphagus sp. 4150]|uniref:hypothetical protein n=1 Tax=Algoriphagus sp. 4150 TaxID=2817756 RepID=UPI002860D5F4|nr:hypothetical protein [Algoriphagus sp. 4150]MDR7129786.1 hypothetical protein [Algoriphagus sp. 4150]